MAKWQCNFENLSGGCVPFVSSVAVPANPEIQSGGYFLPRGSGRAPMGGGGVPTASAGCAGPAAGS